MLVEKVVEQTYRNGHQREVEIVVRTSQMLHQSYAADVQQIRERGDYQESEYQSPILVVENQSPVCLEIEQDAYNGGQEVGYDVGVVEFEQMFEDEEKQIIDKQSERRIQCSHEHKADKLL